MAQNRTYFLTGLFVTIGVMLGVAAVIWLGASKYFQKGSMYATYFDESVQGLQADSVVKFRGVDIGTVKQIGVAPDQRLVEVVMKIEVKDFNVNGVVAKADPRRHHGYCVRGAGPEEAGRAKPHACRVPAALPGHTVRPIGYQADRKQRQ